MQTFSSINNLPDTINFVMLYLYDLYTSIHQLSHINRLKNLKTES